MAEEVDEALKGILGDEPSMAPKTEEERFIADQLQKLIVNKAVPEPMMLAVLLREDDQDLHVLNLGVETLPFDGPETLLPFLLDGCKRHGAPNMGLDPVKMLGMCFVSTGVRLVDNDEAGDAYLMMRQYGLDVELQDFPGVQKTKLGLMTTGTGRAYLATMSEDDDGVQSFDPVQVTEIIPNLGMDARLEKNGSNGIGGPFAETLNELASMFREAQTG